MDVIINQTWLSDRSQNTEDIYIKYIYKKKIIKIIIITNIMKITNIINIRIIINIMFIMNIVRIMKICTIWKIRMIWKIWKILWRSNDVTFVRR